MYTLSDEQEMIVKSVRDLAEREFTDRAFDWQGEIPWQNAELLAANGFLGINIDEEYGGGGLSEFEAMLTVREVGRVCPDTGYFLYLQQMVGPRAIEMFGAEEIKQKYLPEVTAGETAIAIAISEPEAGSDVGAMNTRVEERDGNLVVNGEKIWVSNVPGSSAAVVWVKFPEGLGSVVIDLHAEGVEVAQHYENMAGHTQTHFYIEDVVIPPENVLTRGRDAFKRQLEALNWERLGSATLTNAFAWSALDRALDYAGQREQFDRAIREFQGIEWKLADMFKEVQASTALTTLAAARAVRGDTGPHRRDTAVAKLYAAEMAERVVSEALQIHGANGYQRDHPLEYLYRLTRGRRLAAGTDEIQKNTIASSLKSEGLP